MIMMIVHYKLMKNSNKNNKKEMRVFFKVSLDSIKASTKVIMVQMREKMLKTINMKTKI